MIFLVNSMTGFGRAEKSVGGRMITVEIKSVNHRFFDFSSRISHSCGFLEEKIRSFLQERIARGKIDVSVEIEDSDSADVEVHVDNRLASEYLAAMRGLQKQYSLPDDITAVALARCPDVLTIRRPPEDEEKTWAQVKPVLEGALAHFFAMREAEGERMKEDVSGRASAVLQMVGKIEERSPETVKEYRQKMKERISDILGSADVDEQRILTEAAVYADKVSVAEETVRLRSHVAQLFSLLDAGGPIGRRLDFLVQEMNREANTIGSKCADVQISHLVVNMKAEIEKIREQVQNIE